MTSNVGCQLSLEYKLQLAPFSVYVVYKKILVEIRSTLTFAFHFNGLPDSIMVVRQFLVLFVEVRILVGQRKLKKAFIIN